MLIRKVGKEFLRFLFSPFWGRKWFQPIAATMHLFALKSMNFGGSDDFRSSGELNVLCHVKESLENETRPAVIFDVGANAGNYSLAAEKIFRDFKPGVTIYSFEPSPLTFKKLQANVSSSHINPVNLGLSDKEGTATLHLMNEFSELASLNKRRLDHFGASMKLTEQVRLSTLDSFCKGQGISRIDFLKLDVEGHEWSVLQGAKNMLESGAIRFLQFEFGGGHIDSRVYFQDFYYLLSPRYNIYRVLKHGLHPIDSYRERDEVFITTNYFAELKT